MIPTAETTTTPPLSGLLRNADYVLAAALLAVMAVLIVPLPTALLDIALAVNIAGALLILIMTLSCRQPLEFSTFPSLLLFTTLSRLALNIACTRLILSNGHAGQVIQAFGNFVVGGNLIIGLVIFLILIVIQFIVISKGSSRISEVAARFTLDAMPGKQMAIDAELNAGLINETEARRRRETISSEAEFYGSMDGAGKFVRGDAVAGLIITAINILGGLGLGLLAGLDAGTALKKYATLTVGDGLVSQIPALLISVASGILVTKNRGKFQLSHEIAAQFMFAPRATRIAAVLVAVFGLVPGMPGMPFLLLSGLLFVFARYSALAQKADPAGMALPNAAPPAGGAAIVPGATAGPRAAGAEPTRPSDMTPEALGEFLKVDRLGLEIGYRLIPLANATQRGGLLDHIALLRKQFALQFGFVVPPIRMKDNLSLDANTYRLLIGGQEVGRGTLYPDHYLAMSTGVAKDPLPGVKTVDPTFGLPATWVQAVRRADAEALGYTVIDPESVLVTHLTELIKEHAAEILSRDDVQKLLDRTKEASPGVVAELVPDIMGVGTVQGVLQNLLRERVPVRNLSTILETLADHGRKIKDADALAELVRQRLSRTLVEMHGNSQGSINALTLDPLFEQQLADALAGSNDPKVTAVLAPGVMRRLQESAAQSWSVCQQKGVEPVLLVRATIRRYLADLLRAMQPRIPVLSYNEVTSAKAIEAAGMLGVKDDAPRAPAAATGPSTAPPRGAPAPLTMAAGGAR